MRLAIHQPNYLPWCGYFAKMSACDIFVFLDDADISPGQSYVYRVQVKNQQRGIWLSIPTHRHQNQPIQDVEFADTKWSNKHLRTFRYVYIKAPYFREVYDLLEPIYANPGTKLSQFNIRLIRAIVCYLGLSCRMELSSCLNVSGNSDDRLLAITRMLGADTYISGKGGQKYQAPAKFQKAGVTLEVHTYKPIVYPQLHGEFIPGLSIVDALFNLGPQTVSLLEYPALQVFTADKAAPV